MNAFFLIDKQSGQTSFALLKDMRKLLGIKKIGHVGTLDPLATGCMLIATGEYTKCIPILEGQDKTYVADIILDGVSPSYDSDTDIEHISDAQRGDFKKNISRSEIEEIFKNNFFGKISQIPPKYSALKIQGKRALDRTLAGEEVVMKPREAEILSYQILDFNYPLLRVNIRVSSGTYIRSIAHDLGAILGTGGYLSALRRTNIGKLEIHDSSKLTDDSISELNTKKLFGERLVNFSDEDIYIRLSQGQRVPVDRVFPKNVNFLLFDGKNIRYMVEYKGGVLHPRKKIT